MSFLAPPGPAAAPPPPPTLADPSVQAQGTAARQAAALANGSAGFANTVKTSPAGAPKPKTATPQLFGS